MLDGTGSRKRGFGDYAFKVIVASAAIIGIGILASLAYELFLGSSLSFEKFGAGFLIGITWDPVHDIFGALPFVFGTLVTSAIAILIGVPISLGVAVYLTQGLRRHSRASSLFGSLVEMLAAVPSVVYGLWGLFVLSPFIRDFVEKPISVSLGFFPLFAGTPFGLDFLTAGVILSIMIIPTVSAISREVIRAVPRSQKEAAISLGATDWEVVRTSILPYAKSGLFGAAILGLARAVGETMAVTMVIGNSPSITSSLFHSGYTLASVVANEFTEATSALYISSLIEIGFTLFLVALTINVFARLLVWRITRFSRL